MGHYNQNLRCVRVQIDLNILTLCDLLSSACLCFLKLSQLKKGVFLVGFRWLTGSRVWLDASVAGKYSWLWKLVSVLCLIEHGSCNFREQFAKKLHHLILPPKSSFILVLHNIHCKPQLIIHWLQWKVEGWSRRLRMWDHVHIFWTSSPNVKLSAAAANIHKLGSRFTSDQLALTQILSKIHRSTSLMKVLNQIIYFLSLQSSCLKRNTGPEQRLAQICCLRIPFSSGWLWVHASRTSQNKDHMCLFNVNQTRGWKSPTSCPTAKSKRVEGYAECLWGWKDVGEGGVSGFQGINSNALDFFAWPCLTCGRPRHNKRSKWWRKDGRGDQNVITAASSCS